MVATGLKQGPFLLGLLVGTIVATVVLGDQALHAQAWVEAGCPGYDGGCLAYSSKTPQLLLVAVVVVAWPFLMLWIVVATWPQRVIAACERLDRVLP